jgi:hypothetical protein
MDMVPMAVNRGQTGDETGQVENRSRFLGRQSLMEYLGKYNDRRNLRRGKTVELRLRRDYLPQG